MRRYEQGKIEGTHASVRTLRRVVFTHVTERQTETVGGSQRFVISPALIEAFLPHRKALMEDFLTGVPLPLGPPALPIGGRAVH